MIWLTIFQLINRTNKQSDNLISLYFVPNEVNKVTINYSLYIWSFYEI